jgi:hypothetical protein
MYIYKFITGRLLVSDMILFDLLAFFLTVVPKIFTVHISQCFFPERHCPMKKRGGSKVV